jgi:membrane-bound lytic murein transglycosylase D
LPAAEEPWAYDSLDVPDALDLQFLADRSGISIDLLRELNPAIRRDLTPARMTTRLRLPAGTSNAAAEVLESSPRSEWAPRMIHTVRSGDSLYTIARHYGSSVDEIRQANGLRGSLIHPGQNLIVPRYASNAGRSSPSRTFTSESDGTYLVQRNDTLWDIARGFDVSVEALRLGNGLSRNSVIRPGQRLRIPDATSGKRDNQTTVHEVSGGASRYVVRSGDTLYDIARLHGVSISSLKTANHLRTSRIHPGDVLQIPRRSAAEEMTRATDGEVTYRVRRGDTLYDIARRHGVSVSEIQRINNLPGSRIHPGDVLRIPTSQAKG